MKRNRESEKIAAELLAGIGFLEILPSIQQKAEFAQECIKRVIGLNSSILCINGFQSNHLANPVCISCGSRGLVSHGERFICPLLNDPAYRLFQIYTTDYFFGYLFIPSATETLFDQVEILLLNFLTVLAISLEKSEKNRQLQHLNQALKTEIEERVQAEELVRDSEERLQSIFKNTSAGYFYIEKGGIIRDVNEAWCRLYGYTSREEILGKHFAIIQQLPDRVLAQEYVDGILNGDPRYLAGEFSRKCKDGSLGYHSFSARPVIVHHKPVGIEGFIIDTTERRLAEQNSKENEEKFRALFETMTEGVAMHELVLDENNQAIDYILRDVNPAFEKILEIPANQAKGALATKLYGMQPAPYIQEYASVAQTGIPTFFETDFLPLQKCFEISVVSPRPNWFATVFQDVTERKYLFKTLKESEFSLKEQNEELQSMVEELNQTNEEMLILNNELTMAKEKAEESDRFKTAFLHNISHEIRTPLNAITGFTELLFDNEWTSLERKRYQDIVFQSSELLLSIINDIISIANIESGQEKIHKTQINLNSLFHLLFDQYHNKSLKLNIPIRYFTPLADGKDILMTDRTKLVQVLSNLINNSLKFTKEGYVEFGYKPQDGHILFFVKDTGMGIAKEKQELIFERFKQADSGISRKYGGTGLGLSISRSFVSLMGGKIWVESKPGSGASFYFTLPTP